jgi:hypothetical protein
VAAVRPRIIDTEFHARAGEPGRAERLASTIRGDVPAPRKKWRASRLNLSEFSLLTVLIK